MWRPPITSWPALQSWIELIEHQMRMFEHRLLALERESMRVALADVKADTAVTREQVTEIKAVAKTLSKLLGAMVEKVESLETNVMAAIDNVEAEVAEQKTVVESVVTLLNQLKTKLDEAIASGDMARVQAIADEIDANNKKLADAVVANTPSA